MFAVGPRTHRDSAFAATSMLNRESHRGQRSSTGSAPCGAATSAHDRAALAVGFVAMFIIGGLSGVLARVAAGPISTNRHLLRGGALPLRAVRWHRAGPVPGNFLLVAEDDRPPVERASGQVGTSGCSSSDEPHFFPMHFIGLLGICRAASTRMRRARLADLNLVSTIGAFLIAYRF